MSNIKKLSIDYSKNNDILRNDDSEKFLFIKDKSIGFRKDKKLYKFVGLRNGVDKQFELTLTSVKIDDIQKISANRQNFTSIKDEKNIIHNINELEIISEINNTNFQNFIKINDKFNSVEIIYELHLTGLNYIQNDTIFNIINDDNNIEFIIDKPIIKNELNEILDINISHEIYTENDKIFYKKFLSLDTEISYPIYLDINVIYNDTNYGRIRSSNTLNTSVPRSQRWSSVLSGSGTITKTQNINTLSYNLPNTNSCYLDRFFIVFNTSAIGQYDEIIEARLNINVTGYNESIVINNSTVNNYNNIGWNTVDNHIIDGLIINSAGIYNLDVKNYINKNSSSIFYIRYYNNDINQSTPSLTVPISTVLDQLTFTLDIYYKPVTKSKTFKFYLENNGTGILSSTANDYSDCINGSGVTSVALNPSGPTNNAILFNKITSPLTYTINRTYLTFDTAILASYISDYVQNVTLRLNISNNSIFYLTIVQGEDLGSSPISSYNWSNNSGRKLTDVELTPPDDDMYVIFDRTSLNFNGYTSFIIYSKVNDYDLGEDGGYAGTTLTTSLNFNDVYLEVEIESHKIYGQTYKKVEFNTDFELIAYTNTDSGIIKWYNDIYLLNEIGSGNIIQLNSKELFDNNITKIYSVLKDNNNNIISNNTLITSLDIFNYKYDGLYQKPNNDIPMSIDNVYFRNYSCLNGVCYVYCRIVDEVYEENLYVSDGVGNGSYNLYTEYDIIDEFYSNIYEVDVAIGYNLDITKLYNKLDGIKIIKDSRILLYKQNNVSENGIYMCGNNGNLTRTDELNSKDTSFRAKINVKAGTNLDVEFHTFD